MKLLVDVRNVKTGRQDTALMGVVGDSTVIKYLETELEIEGTAASGKQLAYLLPGTVVPRTVKAATAYACKLIKTTVRYLY
jgi:hypothetical protein